MARRHVDELYSAYLENTLPEDTRRAMDAHLRDCPRCAEGLAAMRAIVATMHALPAPATPDLTAGVRERIRRPAPRLWTRPAWAAAVGLAIALAAAVVTPLWQAHAPMTVATGPTPPTTPVHRTFDKSAPAGAKHNDSHAEGGRTFGTVDTPKPAGYQMPKTEQNPFGDGRANEKLAVNKRGRNAADPKTGNAGRRDSNPLPGIAPAPNSEQTAVPANADTLPATVMMTKSAGATLDADGNVASADDKTDAQDTLRGVTGTNAIKPEITAKSAPSAMAMSAAKPPTDAAIPSVTLDPVRQAAMQPTWADGKLKLHITSREAGTLLVTAGGTARNYPVTPPNTDVTYAATPGAPVTLTLQVNEATVGYLFLAPAKGATPAAAGKPQPVAGALQYWASATGTAVFCPSALAQGNVIFNLDPARPLDALQAFATQHNASATVVNGVAVLAPKP